MAIKTSSYPSDTSDEEGAFCAPYLTLMKEQAPPRKHDLRAVFNALRWLVRAGCFENMAHDLRLLLRLAAQRNDAPSSAIFDSRTLQSPPESGGRAGFDGAKKRKGSKVHIAVDTLGHLLALKVTPANEQDRAQVEELAVALQEVTGENVQRAFVDQGYTGEKPAAAAALRGSAGGGEASRGEARLCAPAPALGGGTDFFLGGALPAAGPRLRTARRHARRLSLAGPRHPHAPLPLGQKFMTGSRRLGVKVTLGRLKAELQTQGFFLNKLPPSGVHPQQQSIGDDL